MAIIPVPENYTPKAEILYQTSKLSSKEFSEKKVEWGKAGHFSASLTPSLMGLYGSPLKVFEQMRTGQWDDLSQVASVQFGQLMEEWVAEKACEMLKADAFKCPYYLGARSGTWLTCSKIFIWLTNLKEGGRWNAKRPQALERRKQLGSHLSSDTSLAYETQCQHQMLVDELDGVYNAVLCLENRHPIPNAVRHLQDGIPADEIMREIPHELKIFVIRRNEEAITQIRNYLVKCRELFVAGAPHLLTHLITCLCFLNPRTATECSWKQTKRSR